MKKITMNGVNYLGNLEEQDGKISIKNCMQIRSKLDLQGFATYFAEKQAKKLQNVNFSGQGITYSVVRLTDLEKLWVKMLKDTMAYAKKTAETGTVNEVFFKTLEK